MNIRSLSVFYEQAKERKSGMCEYSSTPAQQAVLLAKNARKLCVKNTSAAVWKTGNGNIKTNKKVKTYFILPVLYPERIIEHTFHLLPTMTGYDMIIGTDLMSELGLSKTRASNGKMPLCHLRIETLLLKPHSMSKKLDRYEKARIV